MAAEKRRTVRVDIFRYDPETDSGPHSQVYVVPFEKGMSISNLLQRIYESTDPSLAFYLSCRRGKCRGCFVEVNGQVKMACATMVEGDDLTIKPWPNRKVIKDIFVDIGAGQEDQSE